MHQATLIATSASDDAAFDALCDLAAALSGTAEAVIIGGHMVELLCAAFPAPGFVERRTQDSDGGISTEVAATGEVHEFLTALGYSPKRSNRYIRSSSSRSGAQPTIDLLVPSLAAGFASMSVGGRNFDAMPALGLAFNPTVSIVAQMTYRDGTEKTATVQVPSLEAAVILKSLAWKERHHREHKDAIDLHNLFAIIRFHPDLTTTWRLNEDSLRGFRREAAIQLHTLADSWDSRPPALPVDAKELVSRIRTWVTDVRN